MRTATLIHHWKYKGLRCKVLRMQMGHYCGYVAVPKDHPTWGKHYDKIEGDIEVHGGLTFSEQGKEENILNNPDLWWFGFDCAHGWDWSKLNPSGHKWTREEVIKETEKMAQQFYDTMQERKPKTTHVAKKTGISLKEIEKLERELLG